MKKLLIVFTILNTVGCTVDAPYVSDNHYVSDSLSCIDSNEDLNFLTCQEVSDTVFSTVSCTDNFAISLCDSKWDSLTHGACNAFTQCLVELDNNYKCDPFKINICYLSVFTKLCPTESAKLFCADIKNPCSKLSDCEHQFSMYTEEKINSVYGCFTKDDQANCSQVINECLYNL